MSLLKDDLNNLLAQATAIQAQARKRKLVAIAIPLVASVLYLGITILLIQRTQTQLQGVSTELESKVNQINAINQQLKEREKQFIQLEQDLAEGSQKLEDLLTKIAQAQTELESNNIAEAKETITDITTNFKEYETKGFQAILQGDLTEARRFFGLAYDAYPIYHNVDEIYNRVLTPEKIKNYQAATPTEQGVILQAVMTEILTQYSWGMPEDLQEQMQAKIAQ